ncbi:MAG: beta-phosphoglucomutase family hydrolase [Mariniphaga sp.]|nr:beta-phosphoglucomutase family hydrolase [Mariniphaga sp.]MDD4225395.1 beta-phosphoglucomutase family hydrolase [Mariniphaga sp.]MDD4425864.1 beta-phosphoglucomutase family hydrolase [Mariniphaga sp.]
MLFSHPLAFEAVIFDLDGVITRTASTHLDAWKKLFDDYLLQREHDKGEPFSPFTQADYLSWVDGKPRYEGVASFLESRSIEIPWGTPADPPDVQSICGLGNRKNEAFNQLLREKGVEVYPSSVAMLHELKKAGVRLGVASSSKNCRNVLVAADLLHLFDARVDGLTSDDLNLKGKPEPDIFIRACEMVGAIPADSVVIEDAVSGVQAGSKGNFGLVVGIARNNNASALKENGADLVVADLEELNGVDGLNESFIKRLF